MKTRLTITIFTTPSNGATTLDKYYDEHLSLSSETNLIVGGRDSKIGEGFFNTQTDTIHYFCKYINVSDSDYGDFMITLANEGWKL